jgi:hypothetical protein
MKKQIKKKLSLSKETLRNLSERELAGVVGATGSPCCNSCTDYSVCFRCVTDNCTFGTVCC